MDIDKRLSKFIEMERKVLSGDRLYKPLNKDEFVDVVLKNLMDARNYWCGTKRTVSTKTGLAYVEDNDVVIPTIYQSHFWDQFPMGRGEITIGFGAMKENVEDPNNLSDSSSSKYLLNQIPSEHYFFGKKRFDENKDKKIYETGDLLLTGYVIDLNEITNSKRHARKGLDLHLDRIRESGHYKTLEAGGK